MSYSDPSGYLHNRDSWSDPYTPHSVAEAWMDAFGQDISNTLEPIGGGGGGNGDQGQQGPGYIEIRVKDVNGVEKILRFEVGSQAYQSFLSTIAISLPNANTIGFTALSTVGSIASILSFAVVSDTRQEQSDYSYVVYTKTNPTTGQIYIGRTRGTGTPDEVLRRRDTNHEYNALGFGPAVVNSALVNVGSAVGYPAMRGREQQVIDYYGGIGDSMVANKIRGVSKINPGGHAFWLISNLQFGPLSPYTGY